MWELMPISHWVRGGVYLGQVINPSQDRQNTQNRTNTQQRVTKRDQLAWQSGLRTRGEGWSTRRESTRTQGDTQQEQANSMKKDPSLRLTVQPY